MYMYIYKMLQCVYVRVCACLYYTFLLFPLKQNLNFLLFKHFLWFIFNIPIGI